MSFIFINSTKDFGLCTIILLITTNIASRMGKPRIIMEVENFESLINARSAIVNPNTDFPGDPDIIFCGGIAKYKKAINEPAITMDIVDENIENVLTPMIKRSRKIIVEQLSINPGEPATHLTELMHRNNQKKRIISPGSASDSGKPKNLKLSVYADRLRISFPIIPIWERSIIESTMIRQASS